MSDDSCKICGNSSLAVFAHTATCRVCGVLLYWPYPAPGSELALEHGKTWHRDSVRAWYAKSSFRNHANFTNMLRFTMDESFKNRKIDVLDYGGGGGQFALVCRSHFPESTVYITDISNDVLIDEWKSVNVQIPFDEFDRDQRKFDVVFMNDVFEHVSDPVFVLKQLSRKLKTGGRILIDTPKQFWIYPLTRLVSRSIYTKVLRGTVSAEHLQIWSTKAFRMVVRESGLAIAKYEQVSEYTMPSDFYLRNMGITNPGIRMLGGLFYRSARHMAKNKILCVLEAPAS